MNGILWVWSHCGTWNRPTRSRQLSVLGIQNSVPALTLPLPFSFSVSLTLSLVLTPLLALGGPLYLQFARPWALTGYGGVPSGAHPEPLASAPAICPSLGIDRVPRLVALPSLSSLSHYGIQFWLCRNQFRLSEFCWVLSSSDVPPYRQLVLSIASGML